MGGAGGDICKLAMVCVGSRALARLRRGDCDPWVGSELRGSPVVGPT